MVWSGGEMPGRYDTVSRFSGRVRGYDRLGLHPDDRCAQRIAVHTLYRPECVICLAIEKSGSLRDLADLAGRHDEAQRTSERIGQHMDLVVSPPLERPNA